MSNVPTSTNFFASAVNARAGMVPGNQTLIAFSQKNASLGYSSRVAASQSNGAQSPANPVKAPWTFQQLITGKRFKTKGNK